ncbi:hypothetical protein EB837_20515 [Kluyvera ascorbata]|uniref:Uncharacterized protein n=1 Tax=Kluyvera ascorbata TaxID=51288 RepID=A0A3N2RTK1_9ENTR|nr:hypothetical protein EB837_20515 [Kluyvera ascorbata]
MSMRRKGVQIEQTYNSYDHHCHCSFLLALGDSRAPLEWIFRVINWICNHKLGVLLAMVLAMELLLFVMSGKWWPW